MNVRIFGYLDTLLSTEILTRAWSIQMSNHISNHIRSRYVWVFFFNTNLITVWRDSGWPVATHGIFEKKKGSIFRACVGTVPYTWNIPRSINETTKTFAKRLHKRSQSRMRNGDVERCVRICIRRKKERRICPIRVIFSSILTVFRPRVSARDEYLDHETALMRCVEGI